MNSRAMRLAALLAISLMTGLAGCGGGDDDAGGSADQGAAATEARGRLNGADRPRQSDFPTPPRGTTMQQFADSIGATGTEVGLATSVFTPGHNRVAFGVLGDQNQFVYAPTALYVARSPASTKVIGPYTAPADLLTTEPAFRSQQAATEQDPFSAVYQADGVELEQPGKWSLLVVSKVDGKLVAAPTEITVRKSSSVPDRGDKAPRVATDTLATVGGNIKAIDTRRPNDDMHDVSFADVVGKKPVALLFATPQLCQSRVCGPVVDIALQLKQRYGDRVEFIHQEVYRDNDPKKGIRESLGRFGLPTEPWLFTIDKTGRVAWRLEGSFGLNSFEKAVKASLARG